MRVLAPERPFTTILAISALLALAAASMLILLVPPAPQYPPRLPPPPTQTDLLLIRTVLVHYALIGRPLGLVDPRRAEARPLSPSELAGFSPRFVVVVRARTAPNPSVWIPDIHPALDNLLWRASEHGSVSLAGLTLPSFMSFTSVGTPSRFSLAGRVLFTLPGYSRDRAAIHVSTSTGVIMFVFLERIHGRWVVTGEQQIGIS